MTQHEILRMASIGISARIDRENEINEITRKKCGRDNRICQQRLEKLRTQFSEVHNMMGEIERAE